MKFPLHKNYDASAIEEGFVSVNTSDQNKDERPHSFTSIFKLFIFINFLIVLGCSIYALCSLYKFQNMMRSKEEAIIIERYYDKQDSNTSATTGYVNNSFVIPNFREWRKSVLQSFENLQRDKENKTFTPYNLNVVLRTIANTIENFSENSQENQVVIANLTDFEIGIFQELTRLQLVQQNVKSKYRFTRTIKNVKDESACNMHFSFQSKTEPVRVVIKPAKAGEGLININNSVNTYSKDKVSKDVRECSFNIIYEPNVIV